ncbi:P-II family nitrogen regulator [sulfur-oxidizing endosymbiont of Gigantopelta aegis]|uniref:P-II family nitrogen regulator n=1 Tax=sulfur-oxidizing endosymbiont of Gigantopelta aegis TaxID=2794934 RepID=UPI0018DD2F58|nr:P-II family nitrogen regulator [sulfur-oxidizing endosymbiont of Gigantopelta aegis]
MLINITDYNLISEEIKKLNVPGVTVSHVQGYGDYANHFLQLGLCDSLKVEIYTSIEQADEIAQVLADLSMSMTEGGGLVAIEPVSKLLNVKKLAEK